jgi:hypothetical protein
MKCRRITLSKQSTNKEHKDVAKEKKGSGLVKNTFLHSNYHTHAKSIVVGFLFFPIITNTTYP